VRKKTGAEPPRLAKSSKFDAGLLDLRHLVRGENEYVLSEIFPRPSVVRHYSPKLVFFFWYGHFDSYVTRANCWVSNRRRHGGRLPSGIMYHKLVPSTFQGKTSVIDNVPSPRWLRRTATSCGALFAGLFGKLNLPGRVGYDFVVAAYQRSNGLSLSSCEDLVSLMQLQLLAHRKISFRMEIGCLLCGVGGSKRGAETGVLRCEEATGEIQSCFRTK